MSAEIAKLKEELYEWCGGNAACVRAAEYYVAQMQNPCYPPAKSARNGFYKEIIERYGPARRCDVKALVEERLRGTRLEKHVGEIVELVELAKKRLNATSRVVAAAATIVVAEWHACCIIRSSIAKLYGVSYTAVRKHLKHVRWLYIEHIARKNV